MLRIRDCKSASSAQAYYTAHSQSDYYMEDYQIAGIWGGKLAAQFGLSGEVAQQDFNRLCEGRDPRTGKRLLPDQRRNVVRRAGYDWTFDAPKSLSVLWEFTGDKRITAAYTDAVRETMDEAETEMKTRVRKRGANEDRVTANYVWAGWTHTTTRPIDGIPDPHLHMHVFVMNMTHDATEKRIKAGQFGDLKRDAPYWDAAFKARLALKLNALGYATEREGDSFKIAGIDRAITQKFSRRTKQIEARIQALEAQGITLSASEKDRIGEKTRKTKTAARQLAKEALKREWWSWLTPAQTRQLITVANGEAPSPERVSTEAAMRYAQAHVFERNSTLAEKRLKEAALRYGVGSLSVEDARSLVKRDGIYVREVDGERLVTSREVLLEEMDTLRMARESAGRFAPMGAELDPLTRLDGEQQDAALHVLQSRDGVAGIRGGAGTGKTTMMGETITAIRRGDSGREVFVFAPSGKAAAILRGEGFRDATTVEHLLVDTQMQSHVKGSVLWIDEAGMLGSRDLFRVLRLSEQAGCRVVLSGDYRQHGSVGRGNAMLRLMETEGGVKFAELTKVRRQKDARYREAVEMISAGNVTGGFARLDDMGCVVRSKGRNRHAKLLKDYLQATGEGKTALVIAPTRREGEQITARLRDALKEKGGIGKEERVFATLQATDLTEAQRGDATHYQVGLVVQFMQNAKGFKRGERVHVVAADASGVTVERASGAPAALPLQDAARFQLYRERELKLAVGDTIRMTQNGIIPGAARLEPGPREAAIKAPRERISNGASYQVEGFTETGDVRLGNGWVLPRAYGHFRYGLVDTSFGAQGKTVDRVFIAMGGESLGAINKEQWYVSVSRGREQCRIYMDRPDEARAAIRRSAAQLSAVELMRGRGLERVLLERQRLGQFLKDKAAAVGRHVRERLQGFARGALQHG